MFLKIKKNWYSGYLLNLSLISTLNSKTQIKNTTVVNKVKNKNLKLTTNHGPIQSTGVFSIGVAVVVWKKLFYKQYF